MKGFKDFLNEAKNEGWWLNELSCSLSCKSKGVTYSIYQGKNAGDFYGHKSPSGSPTKGEPQELAAKMKLPPIPDDLLKKFLELAKSTASAKAR